MAMAAVQAAVHGSGRIGRRAQTRLGAVVAVAALLAASLSVQASSADTATADELPEDRQFPFACTVQDHGLGQPIVDNQDGEGIPVYEEDADGNFDPETSPVVGFSRDCLAETRFWYYAVGADGRGYVVRGPDDPDPITRDDLDDLLAAQGTTLATAEVVDVDGATEVPYLIRHERGVINRFIHSISVLVDEDEVLTGDPAGTDGTVWNGRLLYQFQGGVGIGHSQGRYDDGASRGPQPGATDVRARAIKGEPDRLGKGYAVIYSTATRTGDHYNLLVGGDTAVEVKDRFVERYGEPRYTVGIGGSGGGIQQYVYNQNHPDLLDAAIPQQSYPDMTTQTIHVGDCALLDRYMDVDAATDELWQDWDHRSWLQGLNSIEGFTGGTAAQLRQVQQVLGLPVQSGSSECLEGWLGLSPLALNPHFGSESNWHLLGDQVDDIERTHWDDAREAYGTDPQTGFARVPWDNVGVQYGLRALQRGDLDPERFLDVNARVGSWKEQQDMVQEAAPFVGVDGGSFSPERDIPAIIQGLLDWDPWSARNANQSPDDGVTPAPRREGDLVAIDNVYRSGLVTLGAPERQIPIVDGRHHLEHVLDMHNVHQSFAARERFQMHQGHSDNQVIWWLATDEQGGSEALAAFYHQAFDTVAAWIANLEADPNLSVGAARPDAGTDACFDVAGELMHAGPNVWDGAFDDDPSGACSAAFEINTTSRIEAGGPISGDVYKCHTMPVTTAVVEGLYGGWEPDTDQLGRLKLIFPDGVCDYGLAGVGDPRTVVPGEVEGELRGRVLHVSGADPAATIQLRVEGETVATATADPHGRARIAPVGSGTYVLAQEVDGARGVLSAPIEVDVDGAGPSAPPGRGGR
jgi:hypothetical protein